MEMPILFVGRSFVRVRGTTPLLYYAQILKRALRQTKKGFIY
jgi:hypothetical protein